MFIMQIGHSTSTSIIFRGSRTGTGGLVFKAQRLLYHPTLGVKVKKKKPYLNQPTHFKPILKICRKWMIHRSYGGQYRRGIGGCVRIR